MKKLFDTAVQKLKYKVLREVARLAFEDQLDSGALLDIPAKIMPGPKPTMRCCIYKERAIIGERIKLAMGGNKKNPNVVEVLDIACDECPVEACASPKPAAAASPTSAWTSARRARSAL